MKFNLLDTTILIPIRIDSPERAENLKHILLFFEQYFEINIMIYEMDDERKFWIDLDTRVVYRYLPDERPVFWRTRVLNLLLSNCSTEFAVLYDADVIVSPKQLLDCISELRRGVYFFGLPYDGRFVLVDSVARKFFLVNNNIDVLLDNYSSFQVSSFHSNGGCFVCNTMEYFKCGLENETIVGWGHDDIERVTRIEKLGYKIYRSSGAIYHLDHPRSANSFFYNESLAAKSYLEYFRICAMSRDELQQNIEKEWRV